MQPAVGATIGAADAPAVDSRWRRSSDRLLLTAGPWSALQDGDGEFDAQVVFRLEATDLSGTPITNIVPGSDFLLKVFVRDNRVNANPAGVFAAYLDINYDVNLLDIVWLSSNPLGFDIEFSQFYQNGPSGSASVAGLIDEAGAFQTGFAPLGAAEILLFQTRFTAGGLQLADDFYGAIAEDSRDVVLRVLDNDEFRVGTAWFTGDPADRSPAHDVIVFSPPSVVPDRRRTSSGPSCRFRIRESTSSRP